jgi:uncharacterized repeat protein (TIGR01451 family)
MRVAFYRGQAAPERFEVPVTVGLRPGYIYRVEISGLPGRPNVTLAPSLEVRGSLHLPLKVRAADHPVPLVLTETDLERVLDDGAFVTKVVYLEDPEKATPTATRPDQPLETTLPASTDLVQAAREFGRPLLVVRLGERRAEAAELMRQAIPGTILLPAERALAAPRVPPHLPWACFPVYDPVHGPRPFAEECLRDGGDVGRPVGIGPDGRVGGLDPSDTVAEYTDSLGRRHLTKSNRICLCVPRFALLRSELPLAGLQMHIGPNDEQYSRRHNQVATRLPSQQTHRYARLTAMKGRQRPTATVAEQSVGRLIRLEVLDAYQMSEGPEVHLKTSGLQQLTEEQRTRFARQVAFARSLSEKLGVQEVDQSKATAVVGRVDGLKLVSATLETGDVTAICSEGPVVVLGKPLHLLKWADRDAAKIGDVVTFHLKYSNNGGQPISDIAVSDSLTGRLEYVANSARSDRNAVFTLQENEAGSTILRWEISGRLLPGDSGVVTFQARVR